MLPVLTEEGIVEAALKYRLMAGVETRAAAGDGAECALAGGYVVQAGDGGTEAVWEKPGRAFGWRLARLGVTRRRDLYGGEEQVVDEATGAMQTRGRWRTPRELGEWCGRGGQVALGIRCGAELTRAERAEYAALVDDFDTEETRWVRAQRGPAATRPAEPRAITVAAAGRGRRGQLEYWTRWDDGTEGWGARPRAATADVAQQLRAAQERREGHGVDGSDGELRGRLRATRGEAWLWLATQAPMALGRREPGAVLEEAAAAGVQTAAAEGGQWSGTAASRARATGDEAAAAMERAEAAARASTTAEERGGWLGGGEAVEAVQAAEDAEAAGARAATYAAMAALEEATAEETAEWRAAAARAEAEWVAARARIAVGEMVRAAVEWAKERPEYAAARRGNAEGPGAAAQLVQTTPPTSYVPSARVMCFHGTLGPAGDDGKRKRTPSLRVSEEMAAEARRAGVPVPTVESAYEDPRVAWEEEGRMWTGAAAPVTAAQAERAARSRELAVRRRAERQQQEEAAAARRHAAATAAARHAGTRTEATGAGDEREEAEDEGPEGRRPRRSAAQLSGMEASEVERDAAASRAGAADAAEGSTAEEAEDGNEVDIWAAEAEAAARAAEREAEQWALEVEAEEEMESVMWRAAEETRREWQDDAVAQVCAAAEAAERERRAGQRRAAASRVAACQRRREGIRQVEWAARELRTELRAAKEAAVQAATRTATAAREAARAAYVADRTGRELKEFDVEARRLEATAAAPSAELEAMGQRHEEEAELAKDAEEQAAGWAREAAAAMAAAKRAAGAEAEITQEEEEAATAVDRQCNDATRAAAARAREAEAAVEAAAAQARTALEARERAAAAREAAGAARQAAREAMAAMGGGTQQERRTRAREQAERAMAGVEYGEDMEAAARAAIARSPALRLCMRQRCVEQAEPGVETAAGVQVGMEPRERAKISVASTKEVAAMALAIENTYGIDAAYAVDGSADETATHAAGEQGAQAAAWGTWDGVDARGGALPPGTTNQVAELVAIERTLARHEAGDRVLILCDCQSAMQMVEAAWRRGELGRLGAMAGRTGGLLVEAIVRHQLRLAAAAADGSGRHGHVIYLWVKAHGGGIAPNACADAIAKSHLAEPAADIPLDEMLPRACVYAVAPEATAASGAGVRRWMVAADSSLRQLVVARMTAVELQRLRAESRSAGVGAGMATKGLDRRLLAATMRAAERPANAMAGAELVLPTATGKAMRLRTDDMRVDTATACALCGRLWADGGHVLRCSGAGTRAGAAAERVAAELRRAAAEAATTCPDTPRTAKRVEWCEAARAAGEAEEALGPRGEEGEWASAEAWATAGWRAAGERYELDGDASATDWRKVAWGAVMVVRASEAVRRQARAAAAASGASTAEGEAAAAGTALQRAARAIGGAWIAADGEPQLASRSEAGAVEGVELRYEQLRRARKATGEAEHVSGWGGEDGEWLRAAHATRGAPRQWGVYTHRGFRRGAGAARRKQTQIMAVSPSGDVYGVAPPTEWPTKLAYWWRVRCATGTTMAVRLRLRSGEGDVMAIEVAAWPTRANGALARDDAVPRQAVMLPIEGEEAMDGARELFWAFGWDGARRTTATAQAVLREAAEAAAGGGAWEAVRKGLSGELPPPTAMERVAERRQREEREQARAEAKAVAEAARRRAKEAGERWQRAEARRRRAARDGEEREARGEAAGQEAQEVQEARRAARVLGVEADCAKEAARAQYLRKALRCHPDKGGDQEAFKELQTAYEFIRDHGHEERRRWAAAGAGQEAAEAATAQERAGDREETEAAAREAAAEMEQAQHEEQAATADERAAVEAAQRGARWERVAVHLSAGADAYFGAWTDHRRQVRRRQERAAQDAGFETHATRRAAEKRERARAAKAAKAEAQEAAVRDMREAEQRVERRRREDARGAAQALGELSGRRLLEAMEADWATVAAEYEVRVPWAAWCIDRCECRGRGPCRHRDSRRHENYKITEVTGRPDAEAPPAQQMVMTLERCAAPKDAQGRVAARAGGGWDKITAHWRHVAGMVQYGAHEMSIRVEVAHGQEEAEDEESDESGTEQEMEAREVRRARQRARGLMAEARAARLAAEQVRDGEAAAGTTDEESTTAAEAAWREEEVAATAGAGQQGQEGEDEHTGTDDEEETQAAAAGSAEAGEAEGRARRATSRARARAGRHWWDGAWMGAVATAEYAAAWGGDARGLPQARLADGERLAQAAAERVGRVEAVVTGREAALGAAAEARRRGRMLQMEAGDRREMDAGEREVRHILEAAEGRRAAAAAAAGETAQSTDEAAARAARRMRREQPATSAAAEAKRASAVTVVARLMASGAGAWAAGEAATNGAGAEAVCAGVAGQLGVAVGRELGNMVRLVMEERGQGGGAEGVGGEEHGMEGREGREQGGGMVAEESRGHGVEGEGGGAASGGGRKRGREGEAAGRDGQTQRDAAAAPPPRTELAGEPMVESRRDIEVTVGLVAGRQEWQREADGLTVRHAADGWVEVRVDRRHGLGNDVGWWLKPCNACARHAGARADERLPACTAAGCDRDAVCERHLDALLRPAVAEARRLIAAQGRAAPGAEHGRGALLVALVTRARHGARLRLCCHCHPRRCHGDEIARAVRQLAAEVRSARGLQAQTPSTQELEQGDETEAGGDGERGVAGEGGVAAEARLAPRALSAAPVAADGEGSEAGTQGWLDALRGNGGLGGRHCSAAGGRKRGGERETTERDRQAQRNAAAAAALMTELAGEPGPVREERSSDPSQAPGWGGGAATGGEAHGSRGSGGTGDDEATGGGDGGSDGGEPSGDDGGGDGSGGSGGYGTAADASMADEDGADGAGAGAAAAKRGKHRSQRRGGSTGAQHWSRKRQRETM